MEQVIAQTLGALGEQGPDWYKSSGEQGQALAANAARLALWIAGIRPGGARVLRLLSGYEVELTPQDPLTFVTHLAQALVGESVSGAGAQTSEESSRALMAEIANVANQVTADITPFMMRAMLFQLCGGLLQQALAEQQDQRDLAARRGTGKREAPETAAPEPAATAPAPPAPPPVDAPAPARPRILRPGDSPDDGPPPPLIFPKR